jgi:hypothetical protein
LSEEEQEVREVVREEEIGMGGKENRVIGQWAWRSSGGRRRERLEKGWRWRGGDV